MLNCDGEEKRITMLQRWPRSRGAEPKGDRSMRATTQAQHGRLARHLERYAESAIEAGLIARFVESVEDDGTVTIDGTSHVNFGSCSYLGLWSHNDLKKAAVSAIEQFGVSFSSSRLYAALPMYRDLEAGLGEICGGTAIGCC